jgi:hypothetical protein
MGKPPVDYKLRSTLTPFFTAGVSNGLSQLATHPNRSVDRRFRLSPSHIRPVACYLYASPIYYHP